ncbi:MAG TPA: phosphoribosylaminoimidazolesuccinocarboxamide synthase [Bacteroidota bacterium]|nr:phosphoribosylaminoimidazolesuccinocarboxamide synthase [Bacteroidota bacterium]
MSILRFGGTSKNFYDSGKEGVLLLTFTNPPDKTNLTETERRLRHSTLGKDTTHSAGIGEEATGFATLINDISSYLFSYLAGFHIPTHFIEKASSSSMLVKHLAMIPLEVQVHNTALGAGARRLGLKEGTDLPFPVIEHYHKRPEQEHPLVNEFHIYAMNIATPEQLRVMNRVASKTNVVLRSFFGRRGLKLQSLSLEFGIANNQIIIGDEISPRTCSLVQQKKGRAIRHGRVPELDTYRDVHSRLYSTTSHEGNW